MGLIELLLGCFRVIGLHHMRHGRKLLIECAASVAKEHHLRKKVTPEKLTFGVPKTVLGPRNENINPETLKTWLWGPKFNFGAPEAKRMTKKALCMCQSKLTEFFAELTEFAVLSCKTVFSKQYSPVS